MWIVSTAMSIIYSLITSFLFVYRHFKSMLIVVYRRRGLVDRRLAESNIFYCKACTGEDRL